MTIRVPRYPKEEFARLGDKIYEGDIRGLIENEQNKGKSVAIDIDTGRWEMDEIAAGDHLLAHIPDAQIWMVRVGYNSLRRFGAARSRWAA